MIAKFCFGEQRILRLNHFLALFTFVLVMVALSGCGGTGKPQVASVTFTTDATGATPICTTAVTALTPENTPVCTNALLPVIAAGGAPIYLYANVTNDDEVLGVSWTVGCAGGVQNNGTCGTFVPAETASGPVPPYPITGIVSAFNPPAAAPKSGTVTLTAHATSLPSIAMSVTLNVAAAGAQLQERPRRGAEHDEANTAPPRTAHNPPGF